MPPALHCRPQAIFAGLNQSCTDGFDAAALKRQIQGEWGAAPWLTCNPSNGNLLGVEVCLDPSSKTPRAVDCPASRAAALGREAGVAECNGTGWMRLGIEVRRGRQLRGPLSSLHSAGRPAPLLAA